jgi:hypothetical protein
VIANFSTTDVAVDNLLIGMQCPGTPAWQMRTNSTFGCHPTLDYLSVGGSVFYQLSAGSLKTTSTNATYLGFQPFTFSASIQTSSKLVRAPVSFEFWTTKHNYNDTTRRLVSTVYGPPVQSSGFVQYTFQVVAPAETDTITVFLHSNVDSSAAKASSDTVRFRSISFAMDRTQSVFVSADKRNRALTAPARGTLTEPFTSIWDAIQAVSNPGTMFDGGAVIFLLPGRYVGANNNSRFIFYGASSIMPKDEGFKVRVGDKLKTVRIVGLAGAEYSIIDLESMSRFATFQDTGSAKLLLGGITLYKGFAADGSGGAIKLVSSSPAFVGVNFVSNSALENGGAVTISNQLLSAELEALMLPPLFAGTCFVQNQAGLKGGALFVDQSSIAAFGVSASRNSAQEGGAIYFSASSGSIARLSGAADVGRIDGPSQTARFFAPERGALATSGLLFVSDTQNNKIRFVNTSTGEAGTVAGTGEKGSVSGLGNQSSFGYPRGLVLDSAQNVIVADTENHMIRKLDIGTGALNSKSVNVVYLCGSTNALAGYSDGECLKDNEAKAGKQRARFSMPYDVLCLLDGTIYVADRMNHAIRVLSAAKSGSGLVVTTLAGNGRSGFVDGIGSDARFHEPTGLAYLAGALYVADNKNYAIRRVSLTGVVRTIAGGVRGSESGFGSVMYMRSSTVKMMDVQQLSADESRGVIYFADAGASAIRMVTPAGAVSTVVGGIAGRNVKSPDLLVSAKCDKVSGIVSSGDVLYAPINTTGIR